MSIAPESLPSRSCRPRSGAPQTPAAYTCTGSDIPSGNYASITVTGPCRVASDAVITVVGDVKVAAGAAFDAQCLPSTITSIKNNTIDGNLTVSGQRTEWLGVLFSTIGKNAKLTNIALSDPHPGAPASHRAQHDRAEPQRPSTDPGSVWRFRPRRRQRRRPPRDRTVRIPGLTRSHPRP